MNTSSPSKLLKIPSKETDTWSPTGSSIVHVDIPATVGYSNLNDTLVLLDVNVPHFDTSANLTGAVRPVGLGTAINAPSYDSDCFIRNCFLESEAAGRLDDMQSPNLLNQNLDFYNKSSEGKKSETSYNGAFLQDEYGFFHSTFRDLAKLSIPGQVIKPGDKYSSKTRVATLPIPLKKLFPFAKNMRFYPNTLMGNTRIELEFENNVQKLVYSPVNPTSFRVLAIPGTAADPRDKLKLAGNFRFMDPDACPLYQYMPINLTYKSYTAAGIASGGAISQIAYFTTPGDIKGVTPGTYAVATANITGSVAGTGVTLSVTVGDESPMGVQSLTVVTTGGGTGYQAGEVLTVDSTHWGDAGNNYVLSIQILDTSAAVSGAVKTATRYITEIEHNANDGEVTLTLSAPLTSVAVPGVLFGNIRFTMTPLAVQPTWEIQKVQVTVPQLLPSRSEVDGFMGDIKDAGVNISWFTWQREPQNLHDAALKFDRQFTLPPNTGNVIVLNARTDSLISQPDNITDFRFRINGQDATVYDISPGTSFYYDTIVQTWTNLGATLNNLQEDRNEEEDFANPVMIMPTVVPLLDEPGFFSLRFRANNPMVGKDIYAYKQVQRVLKISAGGFQIE